MTHKISMVIYCRLVIIIGGIFCFGLSEAAKLSVYTVNYPLMYFAQRIGGEYVDVRFPAPTDIDPAFWMPDINTISAYQKADLILLNGAGYAKWINKVSLPRFPLINTSAPFAPQYINVENTVTHNHGPGGDHSHAGIAFTTWLDFSQAVMQAEVIQNAFIAKRPQYRAQFEKQFTGLKNDLADLDVQLHDLLGGLQDKLFIASHPIYPYFARRYEIKLQSVIWEPGEFPDAQQWKYLQQLQNTHPAKHMLWEDQPLLQTKKQLKELGLSVVIFKPCMNKPRQGDFLSVMRENLENLKSNYRLMFTP